MDNSIPQLLHQEPGRGRAWTAAGDRYIFLADGEQTGGAYCLMEATVPPGSGPPPHYHTREEESFYVLEGEISFHVENRTVTGTPGTFVQIPRGTPHSFKNLSSSPARMLIHCAPAGFDRFIQACATPLPSADSPALPPSTDDIERLLAIAPDYGIHILPPPA